MVFLNILWCAIVNRQTRINKCRAMAPNLGWFQWKAHKYAFQLIMGFHDGKHATMNYVDYKQHATKYIGFLLILARSHSRWFGVKKQYIGQLELLAAVAVYHTVAAHPQLKSQFQGAPVIHFIDNYAAAAGLTKGYSAATASSRVVHAFWALVGAMKCAPWISYIRSKGNIADIPSRMFQPDFDSKDLDVLRCRNAKELKLSMPRVDEWPSMAWAILEASRQADHDESSLRAGGPAAPKRRRR